jgi:hypothetical protein
MIPRVTYGDAAIRGTLRQWKTRLATERDRIDNIMNDRSGRRTAQNFVFKNTVKGRNRALKRVDAYFGTGATLYEYALTGPRPFALWRILAPRPSLFPKAAPDSGLAQDIVSVDSISLAESGFSRGMWALAMPDHAIGRAMQRGRLDPAELILAAHTNLLRLRVESVIPDGVLSDKRKFWLRAGPGAFCCRMGLIASRFNGRAEERIWVFAHTWYANEMLQRHHVVLTPDEAPGEQLGDSWLKPLALRRFPARPRPWRKSGLPQAFDARRPPREAELRCVLEELAGAELVLVLGEYDDGKHQTIKGDELWERNSGRGGLAPRRAGETSARPRC